MPLLIFALLGFALIALAQEDLRQEQRQANLGGAQAQVDLLGARDEAARYRGFALAAQRAMDATPFTGTAVQARTWAEIMSSHRHAVPSHMLSVSMPTDWVIRGNSQAWVICAQLRHESTASLLASQLHPSVGPTVEAHVNARRLVILGERDETNRATYAGWCAQ